jgi:hypothetical protein
VNSSAPSGDDLANAVVFWFFVAAWAIVAGSLVFVVLPACVREGSRIVKRVIGLVSGSPLPRKFRTAQDDLDRILRAVNRLPALQRRAEEALEIVRTTPVVPPMLAPIIARTRAEIAALSRALR